MSSVPVTDRGAQLRLTRPAIAAVEEHDPILDIQTGELGFHGSFVERLERKPPIDDVGLTNARRRHRIDGRRPIHRLRLRALHREAAGHTRFVSDLHDEGAPALLDEAGRCSATRNRDAALGVDPHFGEAPACEDALDRFLNLRCVSQILCGAKLAQLGVRERLTEMSHRFGQPPDLRQKRLYFGEDEEARRCGPQTSERPRRAGQRAGAKDPPALWREHVVHGALARDATTSSALRNRAIGHFARSAVIACRNPALAAPPSDPSAMNVYPRSRHMGTCAGF